MTSAEFIRAYLRDTREIAQKVSVADIEKAIDILYQAWQEGKRVYTCGNGGSASTATHFACDLIKTVEGGGRRGFKAECLNDNIPVVLAYINDNGFENLYSEQLITKFDPGDVLICLSVHGGAGKDKAGMWSQNLLKAIKYAQESGGKAIGFSGFDGGPMKEVCDACITVPADSTPQVESFHLVIEHLIVFRLKEMIASA
jgi:D-sedoheptulose 7-phosphate isomerase